MNRTGLNDTHQEIERIQIELMRQVPPWRKLEMAGEMFDVTKRLALIGLRDRYPHAGAEELHRRLADLILGSELAAKAFGPSQWAD